MRRKFAEFIKSLIFEKLRISKAREIKDLIDKLFEKEREFKLINMAQKK